MQKPVKALVNLHTAQDFVEQLKAYMLLRIYNYRPKALVNLHTAQDFVEQLKACILLLSSASVDSNKPANVYFLSHDLHHVLCLLLLYSNIPFKVINIATSFKVYATQFDYTHIIHNNFLIILCNKYYTQFAFS